MQCIKTLLNFCRSGNCFFFFQALYFSYGFGAFVSPLIAEPFLSGTPHPDLGLPAARRGNPLPYGGMGHRSHHKLSHRPTNHLRDAYYPGSEQYKSEVQVAYWIIALAHVSFSSNVSNTRGIVSSGYLNKIRRAADYFGANSRCLDSRCLDCLARYLPNRNKSYGETEKLNLQMLIKTGYPSLVIFFALT